mmetsp:Transcript_111935/g.316341  ORF Transcript_111935/g.316341 Transcript_111935/m.316341 type:complete len:208 (+) Transcript_111935:310-933(+)
MAKPALRSAFSRTSSALSRTSRLRRIAPPTRRPPAFPESGKTLRDGGDAQTCQQLGLQQPQRVWLTDPTLTSVCSPTLSSSNVAALRRVVRLPHVVHFGGSAFKFKRVNASAMADAAKATLHAEERFRHHEGEETSASTSISLLQTESTAAKVPRFHWFAPNAGMMCSSIVLRSHLPRLNGKFRPFPTSISTRRSPTDTNTTTPLFL